MGLHIFKDDELQIRSPIVILENMWPVNARPDPTLSPLIYRGSIFTSPSVNRSFIQENIQTDPHPAPGAALDYSHTVDILQAAFIFYFIA